MPGVSYNGDRTPRRTVMSRWWMAGTGAAVVAAAALLIA
jgi:hypothetical protein